MTNTVERVSNLLMLNEVTFFLGFPGYIQHSDHMGARAAVTILRLLLLWLAVAVAWGAARYLLIISLVLYALEYFATFFRNNSTEKENVVLCYIVAHVSVINFLLDRPGRSVNSPFSAVITCINILAIFYAIVYLTVAYEFNAAWSCYGHKPKWSELDGGYCATYPKADTSGFGNLHCIDALSSGNLDAYHQCKPGANPVRLNNFFHTAVGMVAISFGIYTGSLSTKIKYLLRSLDADLLKKNK